MNSSERAYLNDKSILQLIDTDCQLEVDENASIDDYNDALMEYQILLDDALARGNKSEISDLRRDIQRCKTEKNILKRMIETILPEKEIALT